MKKEIFNRYKDNVEIGTKLRIEPIRAMNLSEYPRFVFGILQAFKGLTVIIIRETDNQEMTFSYNRIRSIDIL